MSPVALAHMSGSDLPEVRALLEEYEASIGFSLCFQGFDRELEDLPGAYAPPAGRLLVARVEGAIAGCVALRKLATFGEDACEMKRLFVRAAFRGRGIGRMLVVAIVEEARAAGYGQMKLDTVPAMEAALALYDSVGFRDTAPYTANPIPGARFLELRL
jgi:ribosomal protein S18 acetylase RimI-like enzyme